jgi:uncharacterized damage-inducible protein DinB
MVGGMKRSLLADAFDHHVWATLRVLDASRELTSEQLETNVTGTFGPIIDTLRHLVGADAAYLEVLSGAEPTEFDESDMTVDQLRSEMAEHQAAWAAVLDADPDPDTWSVRYRDDGSEGHAPNGIRLAQALHHGTDHRSQVCTALTVIGVEPPAIDVWDLAEAQGRCREIPPHS